MEFRIADTFTDALARLPAQEQKAVKVSAMDLQMNPVSTGLQLHRIDKSKDKNFWSVRVNSDLRLIVHKTASSILLAYVDHHDKAYDWAERRRIETHPKTGSVQIVEVRERVEEIAPRLPLEPRRRQTEKVVAQKPPCFAGLSEEHLLSVGVPADWVSEVLMADEDRFLAIADHLPAEAAEALLEYAATGSLPPPPEASPGKPFEHPDALRRFRMVENAEELEQALNFPRDKWMVFLHPSQRDVIERDFSGPARVAGSAGTGKTVVALHRAVRLGRTTPDARVLLTTTNGRGARLYLSRFVLPLF
jgi:mRNA-degrading endonuclease RelE of RelBE toxin-antitoxin system